MLTAGSYSAVEVLRNGRKVEIRALRPGDRLDLLDAVERTSAQSLHRRFLVRKSGVSEKEIEFFLNVDFFSHVALVATLEEGSRDVIVGDGRYIMVRPCSAEVAFAVVDKSQGKASVEH